MVWLFVVTWIFVSSKPFKLQASQVSADSKADLLDNYLTRGRGRSGIGRVVPQEGYSEQVANLHFKAGVLGRYEENQTLEPSRGGQGRSRHVNVAGGSARPRESARRGGAAAPQITS